MSSSERRSGPKPLVRFDTHAPLVLNVTGERRLDGPRLEVANDSIIGLMESRRSRHATKSLDHASLSTLLFHGARYHDYGADGQGRPVARRAAPSAGAIHPVEMFIEDSEWGLCRYDPRGHKLQMLSIKRVAAFDRFRRDLMDLCGGLSGTRITFIGDRSAVASRYSDGESLLWRDGGALQATLGIIAEAFGLSYTMLGILGEDVVEALDLDNDVYVAMGVAVVGTR